MTWFSSSYPIGAFNFSHGIEYAVESGLIKDAESLERWITGIIRFGSGRIDLNIGYERDLAVNAR